MKIYKGRKLENIIYQFIRMKINKKARYIKKKKHRLKKTAREKND